MNARTPAYSSLVLDVDSTLSGIEGIDWLAARRGEAIARRIAERTEAAMRGAVRLERIYGERLDAVRPGRAEIDALASAYIDAAAPGCAGAVRRMQAAGVRVVLVSGGLRQALLPLARSVGVVDSDVHAVDVWFDERGRYRSYDAASPLTTTEGKRSAVVAAGLAPPILAVGDGRTDAAMKSVVKTFAAYVGFVRRDAVVDQADAVVSSFEEIARLVLG